MTKITEGRDFPIQGTILTRTLREGTPELRHEESFGLLYIGSAGSGNGSAHFNPHRTSCAVLWRAQVRRASSFRIDNQRFYDGALPKEPDGLQFERALETIVCRRQVDLIWLSILIRVTTAITVKVLENFFISLVQCGLSSVKNNDNDEIDMTSWKMCAYNLYSCVLKYQKTNQRS